jgi:hypothetical protein
MLILTIKSTASSLFRLPRAYFGAPKEKINCGI